MTARAFDRGQWPLLIVLAISLTCLWDQFLLCSEERTAYVDQTAWIERYDRTAGRSRYRTGPPAHRWSPWAAGASHYVAHLANGRRFQLADRDNGLLQHGDSVRLVVAHLSGRVLRYEKLSLRPHELRKSGDYYEELIPFPFLLSFLSTWALFVDARSDTAYYLRMSIMVTGLSFLLALFAVTLPLFKALGLA